MTPSRESTASGPLVPVAEAEGLGEQGPLSGQPTRPLGLLIDYLRRELADLYEQVDLQPFSTLITTEYDPATRQVVRSERITPLYQHQEP